LPHSLLSHPLKHFSLFKVIDALCIISFHSDNIVKATLLYNIPKDMSTSAHRTGIANLPLHYGKVPPWLFGRMCQLAREIAIVIIDEFGPEEILRHLSDPFRQIS